MNDLEKYFLQNKKNELHKWKHYFEIYDRHFQRFRGQEVYVLEFGIYHGGSLQMWKEYFGPNCQIYGVDINPYCKQLEEERVEIFIGDQQDRTFLQTLAKDIPKIDILIDDGGHTMAQQISTFEELFPHIDINGVYLCEDTHTSYWKKFGGGYRKKTSYIEYTKGLIDQLHAWHSREPSKLNVSEFTRTAGSLHYYDSVVVIEKRRVEQPEDLKTGSPTVPSLQRLKKEKKLSTKIKRYLKRLLGK